MTRSLSLLEEALGKESNLKAVAAEQGVFANILTGDLALRNLMDVRADKAFLGCTGISPDGEILCGIPSELGINETMIEHADAYFILADYTKIGKAGTYASFHLEKKGCVITDELAPGEVLDRLRAIGMQVIQARAADYPEVC